MRTAQELLTDLKNQINNSVMKPLIEKTFPEEFSYINSLEEVPDNHDLKESLNALIDYSEDEFKFTISRNQFNRKVAHIIDILDKEKIPSEAEPEKECCLELEETKEKIEEQLNGLLIKIKDNKTELNSLDNEIKSKNQSIESLNETLDNLKTTVKEKLEEVESSVNEIKKNEKWVKDFNDFTSKSVTASEFKNRGEIEEKTANWLRWTSILFIVLAVIAGLLSFIDLNEESFLVKTPTLIEAQKHLFISILLFIPTIYFSRESNKHRKTQYEYEKTALDLASIDGFISNLDSDNQTKIKQQLADRIFAKQDLSHIDKDSVIVPYKELMELIKQQKKSSD